MFKQKKPGRAVIPTAPTPEQLKRFRNIHKMTQQHLAEQELGIPLSTLQNWEYEASQPPPYLSLALRDIARRRREIERKKRSERGTKARAAGIRRRRPTATVDDD